MKDTYYCHGKWFDDEDAFFKFVKEWPDMPFDLEDFKNMMAQRIQEAEMNSKGSDGKLTNREAYAILRISTDWAADAFEIEK